MLQREKHVKERRRQARDPARKVPELVATDPGEVFTGDITKRERPQKGTYFDAYVMIDIYSRCMVGVPVHAWESGELAKAFMVQVFARSGDEGDACRSRHVGVVEAGGGVAR